MNKLVRFGSVGMLAGHQLEFAEGELVHTEYSYKYRPDEFIGLARSAGFAPVKV
ncbi:MAG: putative SAM-dependent methyltransferase [Bacteroidia bacterium]|jgi:uncharacterized SAM-dependent methyltransferase